MCFDVWTTKTKLCAKMPNELGSIWTYFLTDKPTLEQNVTGRINKGFWQRVE